MYSTLHPFTPNAPTATPTIPPARSHPDNRATPSLPTSRYDFLQILMIENGFEILFPPDSSLQSPPAITIPPHTIQQIIQN